MAECVQTSARRHKSSDNLPSSERLAACPATVSPSTGLLKRLDSIHPPHPRRSNPHSTSRDTHVPLPRSLYGAFFVKEFARAENLSSFVSFFVRSQSPFPRPDRGSLTPSRAGAVKVGRRAKLAACSELARPYLDSFEHDGTLGAIGMTIRGGARLRARISRATTLYSVGPRTRTMMQSYASAAKLRSGGPILPFGIGKPRKHVGTPPPRTVIGAPSPVDGPGRNCWVSFSDLRSLCRPQNDAVRHHALPHETPQGDQ